MAIHDAHPGSIDPEAIERANSIWGFDNELVINRLGFSSVEAYYQASSALQILPQISKPTLILYAADDPLFDPAIIPELEEACDRNSAIDLLLTQYGGHVGYLSSKECQRQLQTPIFGGRGIGFYNGWRKSVIRNFKICVFTLHRTRL